MVRVKLTDLLHATHGTPVGLETDHLDISRICTDSREIQPGDIFWALTGPQHDGHNFIPQAFDRGATACVASASFSPSRYYPTILVNNTLRALGDLAQWHRQQQDALVIGVTGSVGKTSTREMIHAVLSQSHTGTRSRKNYNNEIGLPLSLLDISRDDDFAVLEMGAGKVGDIRDLCELAGPEIGVITTIAPAHLSSFGSLEAVAQGKGELLEALPYHGFAVLNGDDERLRHLAHRAACRTIFVGEQRHNHVIPDNVSIGQGRLQFVLDHQHYTVPTPGRHSLTAALSALAIGREIGMSPRDMAAGLVNYIPPPGRCQIHKLPQFTIIDDTYNASPASMRAASELLQQWPAAAAKIFIAGDMLELGTDAPLYHYELGQQLGQKSFDRLLTWGNHAEIVVQGAIAAGMSRHRLAACHDLETLFTNLDCWLEPEAVILVKGSRGMRMERVVAWLQQLAEMKQDTHRGAAA